MAPTFATWVPACNLGAKGPGVHLRDLKTAAAPSPFFLSSLSFLTRAAQGRRRRPKRRRPPPPPPSSRSKYRKKMWEVVVVIMIWEEVVVVVKVLKEQLP
ncbi:hypothetical protein HU200_067350 [Digitaria exilis]|uniref:Uncharacterized protein n=1 Tax=Digitaria exilis TaxID=1010633 RepID=A0A834ZZF5_9POAL|nr:hypothetical protein HU200_067349 [Digitaria exilis]KAF8642094.1 hypothetical protein HU200_067350 [Digitaria exilis]